MPGSWEPIDPIDMYLRAIHLVHLKNGKYLYWADGDVNYAFTQTRIFNPNDIPDAPLYLAQPRLNLHCCGHSAMADGRILAAGGEFWDGEAPAGAAIFTPAGPAVGWVRIADMHLKRWYPTCTTLPSGKVAVFAGWITDSPVTTADTPEVNDPATDT